MKVKVIISFHDASDFARVYQQGDIIDVTEERAQALQNLKLVEPCEEEGKKAPKEESKEAKKEKTPKKKS